MTSQASTVFSFNRYGTDYTVQRAGASSWQFRRSLAAGGRDSYYAEGCGSIREALLDYFHGVDDAEVEKIMATISVGAA